jgi:rhodanese-related sulfurtransferase
MAFLPDSPHSKQLAPEKLLAEINSSNRFKSTDEVARLIIQQDPLLLLVDVRTAEEYAAYHLPGAISIPLSEILSNDMLPYFDQKVQNVVLYSNGTIFASQAWSLLRRKNFRKLFVMEGGLNLWVETILRPSIPNASASKADVTEYEFRKGASMFFGGSKGGASVAAPAAGAVAPPAKAKKSKAVSGGC